MALATSDIDTIRIEDTQCRHEVECLLDAVEHEDACGRLHESYNDVDNR